jgi:hypothetical protein
MDSNLDPENHFNNHPVTSLVSGTVTLLEPVPVRVHEPVLEPASETDSLPDLIPLQEDEGFLIVDPNPPLWPIFGGMFHHIYPAQGDFFSGINPLLHSPVLPHENMLIDDIELRRFNGWTGTDTWTMADIWEQEAYANQEPVIITGIDWLRSDEPVIKERCPICYTRRFHKMQRTDCGHLFCQLCCSTHFAHNRNCPICRARVERIWLCKAIIPR